MVCDWFPEFIRRATHKAISPNIPATLLSYLPITVDLGLHIEGELLIEST